MTSNNHLRRAAVALGLFALILAAPGVCVAGKPTTIDLNIGLGPSFYMFTGPIQEEQVPHFGLRLGLFAVPPRDVVRRKTRKASKRVKKALRNVDELRISHFLIPQALIISPGEHTQMYGATWRPLGINLPLLKAPRLTVGTGLVATYAFIDTDYGDDAPDNADKLPPEGSTHFLRPGLTANAELEVPLGKAFRISLGWESAFYIPQELGKGIFEIGDASKGIWHVGQVYVLFNLRTPYQTRI